MKALLIILLIIAVIVMCYFSYHSGKIRMEDELKTVHEKELKYAEDKYIELNRKYKDLKEDDAQLEYFYNYVLALYVNNCAGFRKELKIAKVVYCDNVIGIRIKINNKDVILPVTKNIPVTYNCPIIKCDKEFITECDEVTAELINYLNSKYSK